MAFAYLLNYFMTSEQCKNSVRKILFCTKIRSLRSKFKIKNHNGYSYKDSV